MVKWVVKKIQKSTYKIIEIMRFNTFQDAWEFWQRIRYDDKERFRYTSPEREYS